MCKDWSAYILNFLGEIKVQTVQEISTVAALRVFLVKNKCSDFLLYHTLKRFRWIYHLYRKFPLLKVTVAISGQG